MPKLTFIGRVSDGMMLCETYEDLHKINFDLRNLAKKVMKKLQKAPEVSALETQLNHTFYYKISDGICYLTCVESSYHRKLALAFLDEIMNGFQEELKKTFGTGESVDYRSKIETIERPYYFLKFDRFIRKKREQYLNPSKEFESVHKELENVTQIIKTNINTLLERDKTLGEIEGMAGRLRDDSKLFAKKSRELNMAMWLRKYGILIAIAAILLLGIYYRFG